MEQKEQSSTDIEIHYTETPANAKETAMEGEKAHQYEDVDHDDIAYENADEGTSGRESYIA